MRLIKQKTSIDFLSPLRRKVALVLSLVFIVVSIGSLATRGLEFGIDFTGGLLIEVGYPEAANIDGIRGFARDRPVSTTRSCSSSARILTCSYDLPPQERRHGARDSRAAGGNSCRRFTDARVAFV